MMDDAELIARLRGWAKDIQEGSEAIWAMDQDLKGAADRIEALIAAPDMAQISDMWLPINDRPAVWPWVVAAAVVVALIATVGMAAHAAAVAQAATMGAW